MRSPIKTDVLWSQYVAVMHELCPQKHEVCLRGSCAPLWSLVAPLWGEPPARCPARDCSRRNNIKEISKASKTGLAERFLDQNRQFSVYEKMIADLKKPAGVQSLKGQGEDTKTSPWTTKRPREASGVAAGRRRILCSGATWSRLTR